MGSGYYLPEEIIFMVLSFLPVISLLRFRSVCKAWRSMISIPQFIETHLTNSHKKQGYALRFSEIQMNEFGWLGNYDNAFYIDTRDVSVTFHLPPQFSGINRFVRSCNGLVCLSNMHGYVIYLWNPFSKRFKGLPTPKKQARSLRLDLGLCFDSILNDYKILRIVLSNVSYDGLVSYILEAELYSANADSWKEIEVPKKVQSFMPYRDSKCVHTKTGVLYLEGLNELLLFDSHNEVFGIYPFPNSEHHKRKSNVLDFDGSVAMIYDSDGDGSVLSLWMLDDVSGKMSWIKKFNFEAHHAIDWIVLYLGVGDFVAQNYVAGYFFYDYKKKESKNFPLPAIVRAVISAVKYTESLVSFKGFELLE